VNSEQILLDDEFWLVRTMGSRYFTATSKCHDEHRMYFSRDAVERDFGSRLHWQKPEYATGETLTRATE